MINDDLIRDEEKNLRRLKWVVDLTASVLMQSDLTLQEALSLMDNTKKAALSLFPDKAFVYDLIYTSRFLRIVDERFKSPVTQSAWN